jgi:hypothetical protein
MCLINEQQIVTVKGANHHCPKLDQNKNSVKSLNLNGQIKWGH